MITLPAALAAADSLTPARRCPPVLLDGMLVQAEALSLGLDTMLFPGQALLVTGSGSARVAFAHGVPQLSQLSMASFVQDKRIRRALLEQRCIPVPKGATFSVGRGRPGALEYAERLGYPLNVKPMVGDSTVENFVDVADAEELNEVFAYFRTAAPYRERYEAASYAFTAIHMPKEDTRLTKASYRLLLEQKVPGQYMRFLMVGGALVSAVHLPGGLHDLDGAREVLEETHWTVREFVTGVGGVFGGLRVVVIDVVLGDGHQVPMGDQAGHVVEVAERPWLYVQEAVAHHTASASARRILEAAGATRSEAGDGRESLSVQVEWQGVTQTETFVEQIAAASEALGLICRVDGADAVGGIVTGRISGGPEEIALLNELVVAGHLEGERIMAVRCRRETETVPD